MRLLAATCRALAASSVSAQDFSFVPNPVQADFASVSKDVIAVMSYKALGPAEAGGVTGFSVGAYGAYSSVQNEGAWRRLTGEEVDAVGVVAEELVGRQRAVTGAGAPSRHPGEGAGALAAGQQALADQTIQRLAHRNARDAEFLGHVPLGGQGVIGHRPRGCGGLARRIKRARQDVAGAARRPAGRCSRS